MQDHAADELHVEMAHVDGAAASLAAYRKGLGQDAVQGLAVGDTLLEQSGLGAQVGVALLEQIGLELADARDEGTHALEDTCVSGAEDFLGDGTEQGNPSAPR